MTSPRHEKHHCRHCTFSVGPTTPPVAPAHTHIVVHVPTMHPGQTPPGITCGKQCSSREQAEERRRGGKLYGPGSLPPEQPLLRYEDAQDDHS